MLQRCYNSKCKKFRIYGGRGISVCKRWKDSFGAFVEDMGFPASGESIDRIDCNGNYEPGNCRWASQKQQCRNKRNNRLITAFGQTKPMAQWSEDSGIPSYRIQQRIDVEGWSDERAVSTPLKKGVDR